MNFTQRQIQIIKAIVEEYISSADPVSSEQLEKKHNLHVSPATIRNEMTVLTKEGFLKQPHTSAGRVPTPMALRFYVDHLMQEKKLSVTDEVSSKEQIWDARNNFDQFMRQSCLALAQKTKTLSVITTDKGGIYYAGTAYILDMPEFFDIDVTRTVLSLLDEQRRLFQLFFERVYGEDPIHIIFGADLGWTFFEPVGMAFTYFDAGLHGRGSIACIGPTRLNFPYIVPTLRYFSGMINDITAHWS